MLKNNTGRCIHSQGPWNEVQRKAEGVWVVYISFDTDYITLHSLLRDVKLLIMIENLNEKDHQIIQCDSKER